jgi:hypothetical protein
LCGEGGGGGGGGGVWVVASFSIAFRMHATVADADLLRVNES